MNLQPLNLQRSSFWANGLIFAAAMWLFSRVVIVVAMVLLAPLLPTPEGGVAATVSWDVFSRWDSYQYKQIVTSGYEYVDDSKGYNVVFFPLFPLAIRAVMALGLPFEVSGTLVNNLAFLGALIVLYLWVEERHSREAARWATAALAWCPFSLFGTVIYTEGLFLLLSTAALRAFDKQQYLWVAIWGALATATRPTGMTIIPAFLIVAWKERRPAIAYFASLAASTGLLLYTLYCGIQFGNPLAFILNQRGWQPQQAFHGQGWLKMLVQISAGSANWKSGSITDPWHPLLFILICGCGYLLWRFRTRLGSVKTGYGVCFLIVLLWLLAGAPLINAVMVFGGAYLLWQLRAKLRLIAIVAGVAWFLIATQLIIPSFSGTEALAVNRYAYLGNSVLEIAKNLLLKPGLVLGKVFSLDTLEYLGLLVLPVIWGLSPQHLTPLVGAIPTLLLNILSESPAQRNLVHQYSLPILPFLVVAVISTLASGKGWLQNRRWIILWSFVAFLALAKYGYFGSIYLDSLDTWQATRDAIAHIQPYGSVLTPPQVAPHLTHRPIVRVAIEGSESANLSEFKYVLLNLRHPGFGSTPQVVATLLERLKTMPEFQLTYQNGDVYLFEKRS